MVTHAGLNGWPSQRPRRDTGHVVVASRILCDLGIDAGDLGSDKVVVDARALRKLLTDFARLQFFDPEFYADTYPDIEAARLAGIVADLHAHFAEYGFFEGRLPAAPDFDPVWYAQHYPDLASHIPAHDTVALRNHFFSAGLAEGRVGTAASLIRAELT